MSWHRRLGVLAAFLLPLPLVLVLHGALRERPGIRPPVPGEARVSPVLSSEERLNRQTYRRHCQKTTDCEAPLGCFGDADRRAHYCIDSQCTGDPQCPEGMVCRKLDTVDNGPLVRRCVPLGPRKEGEQCLAFTSDPREACGPGLVCGGRPDWCGRPCEVSEATSCPAGFFCASVAPEPICLPTCEKQGCPEGQRCVRDRQGASACATVYGADCQHTPCPEGRECDVTHDATRPGESWMECVRECGDFGPPCPEGLVCDYYHCLPPCDPHGPNPCAKGYHCTRRSRRLPYTCQPNYLPMK
jgi:hypothetical protein